MKTAAEPRSESISPLALAALAGLAEATTARDVVDRLGAAGALVEPGAAEDALRELVALGLARVARVGSDGPEFVPTSLGRQALARGFVGGSTSALEELERLRTDLLSTIAHELRTPLTAVRTVLGLLRDPASRPTEEQRSAMLETAERNAERMQRLVGEILDLARFRSGSIRLQLRAFDASELAESAAAAIRPLALRRGQHLDVSTPAGGGPVVYGDHRRLEQALLNLASNAQRFAPDGGSIGIGVAPGAAEGSVAWAVSDDGPGIPLADQARLFERFFVGRGDENAAREGVGLGLPTALAIAQAHGGTIEVRSAPGEGSTFELVVPLRGPDGEGDE
ncbi:MAG TPA: HAMP domain-containing sensor histidine kinase [Candidatus Limnocylindrales bacterium]|nr:HAMP domain-containing sensor histidine kinase [Candidatus Limnocylindrales bacterium]